MKCIMLPVVAGFTLAGLFVLFLGFCGYQCSDPTGWIDPVLETKLLGVFFLLTPWIGLLIIKLKFRKDALRRERIMQTGELRSAVLLDFQETGTYVNNAPQLRMVFELTDDAGTEDPLEIKAVVDLLQAATLKKGMKVQLTVSREGVIVHWDQA